MKTFISSPTFSNSLLSGLLTGIIAALLNLVYVIVYRESTNFGSDLVVMPLTIFIGFPILMVLAGLAYFLLQKHLHSGSQMVYEHLFYRHDRAVNPNHPGYQHESWGFADRSQGTFPWDGGHYFSSGCFSDSLSGQAFKNISVKFIKKFKIAEY